MGCWRFSVVNSRLVKAGRASVGSPPDEKTYGGYEEKYYKSMQG